MTAKGEKAVSATMGGGRPLDGHACSLAGGMGALFPWEEAGLHGTTDGFPAAKPGGRSADYVCKRIALQMGANPGGMIWPPGESGFCHFFSYRMSMRQYAHKNYIIDI